MSGSFQGNVSGSDNFGPIHGAGSERLNKQEDSSFESFGLDGEKIKGCALESLQTGSNVSNVKLDARVTSVLYDSDSASEIEFIGGRVLFGDPEEVEEYSDIPDFMSRIDIEAEEPDNELVNFEFEIEELTEDAEEAQLENFADLGFIYDQSNQQVLAGSLSQQFFKDNAGEIGAFLLGDIVRGGEDSAEEIFDLIRSGRIRFIGDVKQEIKNILMKEGLELEKVNQDEWEQSIKDIYFATLGIRIEIVRHKSMASDAKNNGENIKNSAGVRTFVPIHSVNSRISQQLQAINMISMPLIEIRGKFLEVLKKLEIALYEKREDLKEEERQNRNDRILSQIIQAREIQYQSLSANLKKEKIWFENTTSFLRYLLKRDRKIALFKIQR